MRDEIRDDERQHRRRQDPPGAPDVEVGEPDTPVAAGLAKQQPGDQIAGEDEEDVDPDVATLHERQPGVVEHHEQDRDRSQPLQFTAMRHSRIVPPNGAAANRHRGSPSPMGAAGIEPATSRV